MYLIYSEWCAILLFIVVAVALSCVVFGLSYAFIARSPDIEKFRPMNVDLIHLMMHELNLTFVFYIVAILFIVFDLEIIFLCPWSLVLRKIDSAGFWGMMFFLVILTIGFVFEWRKGALDWS